MRLLLQTCQGNMDVLRSMHVWQVAIMGHSLCARHGSGQWLRPSAGLALLLCTSGGVSHLMLCGTLQVVFCIDT